MRPPPPPPNTPATQEAAMALLATLPPGHSRQKQAGLELRRYALRTRGPLSAQTREGYRRALALELRLIAAGALDQN